MYVSRHHRQRNIALETIDAMIGTAVEPLYFQPIDRGFHRRVRTSGVDKRPGLLNRPLVFALMTTIYRVEISGETRAKIFA